MPRVDLDPTDVSVPSAGRPPRSGTRFAGDDGVPRGLAVASAVIVRLVVVLGGLWLLGLVVTRMLVVVLPLVVALLLATLFAPPARALERRGWRPALAALTTVGSGLIIVAATLSLVIPGFVTEIGTVAATVEQGIRQLGTSIADSPLGISERQINASIDRAVGDVGGSGNDVARGVITGALVATQVMTAAVLAIFLCFFFVKDGPSIWRWLISLLGPSRRATANEIGVRAWRVLTAYVHGVALVATVDAVLIGIVLVLVDVPLALPLVVLTFMAAFFPIIGAVVAGAAAVLVALVTQGLVAAVIVLVGIIFIQQLEGNVLYPVVVGRQLNLHPVAMLIALSVGAVVAGVAGAFLAVPVAAVFGAALNYARSAERLTQPDAPPPQDLIAPTSALRT